MTKCAIWMPRTVNVWFKHAILLIPLQDKVETAALTSPYTESIDYLEQFHLIGTTGIFTQSKLGLQ